MYFKKEYGMFVEKMVLFDRLSSLSQRTFAPKSTLHWNPVAGIRAACHFFELNGGLANSNAVKAQF